MDDYERQRFDAVADGLAKTTATITNIQQVLTDHVQREDRDREQLSQSRIELAQTLSAIQANINSLTNAVKLHTDEIKIMVTHIDGCKVNQASNKKLVSIAIGASSIISAFVSAAAWAAQHYKG